MVEAIFSSKITEYYSIEKIIEVDFSTDKEHFNVRLETLHRSPCGEQSYYTVRAYSLIDITSPDQHPEAVRQVWAAYPLGWIRRDTAGAAIEQALALLAQKKQVATT